MIFKQYREIVEGKKTQTRRICGDKILEEPAFPPFARVLTPGGKLLHEVGRTYAVVPGRGKPVLWVIKKDGKWTTDVEADFSCQRFRVQIRILSIRREPLQAITEEDAKAEGVDTIYTHQIWPDGKNEGRESYVSAYRHLWNSINNHPGICWEDNPDVFVYTFECVLE